MFRLIFLLIFFISLSITDLALTYQLVGSNPNHEANPIASYIITHYSFEGLIVFKILATTMTVSAIWATWKRGSKTVALKLGLFACIVLNFVVVYSLGLFHAF